MSKELDYLASRVIQRKMNRRSFIGRASALGLSAGAASTFLSTAANAAGPVMGGTIKVAVSGGSATDSLDPALSTNPTMATIIRMWAQPLLELSETGGLDPIIAEEFSASADARIWTFKIRKGISFSNGQPLTAEDVLATLERHAGEESKSGALGILRGIKDMRVDNGDFVIELETPNADLPYLLTDYHLMIQPNGGKDNPTAAIGTGPYMIKEHEAGVRTVFERNPHAWLDGMGYAESVEILPINDDTARMSAIQSGQVHIANRVPPKIVGLISRAPGVNVHTRASPGHYVFIMHANTAPFDNNNFRMALKYGINRQEMVDKILFGYGSVGNDTPINASYPLYTAMEQREYDPEKAASFYKASGHEGPILLRTSDNSFPGAPDAAALFQQSLKGAGIDLEIKREPNDGYWSEVWNNKPFCTSYWSGRATQDAMFSTAYLSTADWNDTRFHNEQFDQLLIAARAELNEGTRTQMYADLNTILRDEGGLICPMFNDFIDATTDKVAGWGPSAGFDLMNDYAPAKLWLVG